MRARLKDFANIGPKMPLPGKKATRLLVVTAVAAASLAVAPAVTAAPASAQTDRYGDQPRRGPVRQEDLVPPDTRRADPDDSPRATAPEGRPVGVLSGDRGGLGANIWRGLNGATIAALMERLPARTRSRVLHDLTRRLLLTAAEPPVDAGPFGLVPLRMKTLYAMAAFDGLAALHRAAPRQPGDVVRFRAAVAGLLLEGRVAPACEVVKEGLNGPMSPFLERASIVCHARQDRAERAAMAMGLLREAGQRVDPDFEALVAAAIGRGAPPARIDRPTALHIALMPAGRFPLPALPIDALSAPMLRGVVVSGKEPRAIRIAAGERLAAYHALPDGLLAALYAGADVSEGEIRAARQTRLRDYGRDARVRLYQAAALETNTEQRMLILAAWWRLAVAARDEPLTARLTAPLLKNVRPGSRWQDNASHIARVYFWTGRLRRAMDWYRVLKDKPFRNPDDFYRLTAMASLAGKADSDDLRGWRDYRRRHGDADAKAARLLSLLTGLDEAPDEISHWRDTAVSPRPAGPADADLQAIEAAAAGNRRGETVLRILITLGAADLDKAAPATLTTAIAALRRVGLAREARALAVEAALQAGL